MSAGFDVYDDTHALVHAQRKMRRALVSFGVASVGIAGLAPALAFAFEGALWVPVAACALLTVHAAFTIRRLSALRRRVWRVSVSARHVVALDAGRRQTTVAWAAVERVEVDGDGFTLVARGVGGGPFRLHVCGAFSEYVTLAHELVAQAERRRRPIWVDGTRWQDLPIEGLLQRRADVLGEA